MANKDGGSEPLAPDQGSIDRSNSPTLMTRRQLLKLGGIGGLGAVGLLLVGMDPVQILASPAEIAALREVYGPDAKGLLIHIPSRCVGCRRCVYACVNENNQSRDPQIQWIRVLKMNKENTQQHSTVRTSV